MKASITPAFGRHETFTPRYAWVKRGYDAVVDNPRLFAADDAHQVLAVGKNMGRSIRYWVQALRVVEEVRTDGSRFPDAVPTMFGKALLDEETGLDPYLEEPGSWWLLHWMALSPGGLAPVWWAAFHTMPAILFTTESLLEHVTAQISASGWGDPHPSTVRRDVLALLRAYAGGTGSRRADKSDDLIDAPFVPLGLIRPVGPDEWRFGLGPKPGLPPAVAAFACLDYLSRTGHTARQALVGTLAAEHGGPGQAFKLSERDLASLLERAAAEFPEYITSGSSAGSDLVAVPGDEPLAVVAARLLNAHYRALGSEAPRPKGPYLPWSPLSELRVAVQLSGTRRPCEVWT